MQVRFIAIIMFMSIYFYIYLSVFLVSLVSLLGVFFLSFSPKFLKKLTIFLVSLSAGTLIGGSFLHLLPETIEKNNNDISIWIYLIVGILLFFVLEKVVHWRHCHYQDCSSEHPHHLGPMTLAGDSLHNFFDGLIIAGSFMVSIPLGVATLIAIILHEIPQEIGDFGVLIHSGYSRKKALFLNFITALTALLGASVGILLGGKIDGSVDLIIPFAAGGFIYVAIADLIPEMKKETSPLKSFYQLMSIVLGVLIMLGLKLLFE